MNGTYRTFEILYIIAQMLDNGSWTKAINTVWDSYRSGNNSASSAAQQQVNGSYRTFEILYVIAQILDN